MILYFHYARLLTDEACKQFRLSQLADDSAICEGHLEVMLALWVAAELLRREGRRLWHTFPKSEKKRRLSLSPLRRACRENIQRQ